MLLNLFFPQHCFVCRVPLSSPNIPYLCSRDAGNLIPIAETACPRCSLPLASPVEACPDCHDIEWAFDRALSLFQYKEPVSQIIQSFKYDKKRFLIRSLKALMQMQMKKKISVNSAQIVTSVPLSAEKEKERGFNQAHLLAEIVATHLRLPVVKKSLKRLDTPFQHFHTREERWEHIRGQMKPGANAKKVEGRNVLLVDDVLTTGATANECSSLLKSLGAKEITVFSLARTPLRD